MRKAANKRGATSRHERDRGFQLHLRAIRGDESARNQIVEENVRLAYWFHERHGHKYAMDMESVVSAAMFGLLRAAEHHDPRRGYRFSTTAVHWMRKAVAEDARESRWHGLGLPAEFTAGPRKYMEKHAGKPWIKRTLLVAKGRNLGSNYLDELTDDASDPGDETAAEIDGQIDLLPEQYRDIVRMLHGIGAAGKLSAAEVAERLGISSRSVARRNLVAKKSLGGMPGVAAIWREMEGRS